MARQKCDLESLTSENHMKSHSNSRGIEAHSIVTRKVISQKSRQTHMYGTTPTQAKTQLWYNDSNKCHVQERCD